jgi:uncharacterized protein YkwD
VPSSLIEESETVNRIATRIFPLSVAVCLLALLSSSPGLAQNKAATKKRPPADKTLSSTGAGTIVEVAPKTANPSSPSFVSPLEKEIIDEMNLARSNPQQYATFIEEFKKYYDGNRLTMPGRKKAIVTFDGVAAVDEAINFLRATKPLPPLEIVKGMCLAAKDHANDLAVKGLTGHRGSDGSSPNARVDRYGRWEGAIGETIVYEVSTARQIVISLIIDDGVPNRGHRRNIFDPNYRVAGVSINNSSANGVRCVVDYAGGFTEKAAEADNR